MYKILLSLLLLVFSLNTFAQEDPKNQENQESPAYLVYDVIYMEDGKVLKGEILSFDEASGSIVFKDQEGRTYSIGREEYKYFKENQSFPLTKKKERVLKERKNNDWAFQVGLGTNLLNFQLNFDNNDYVVNKPVEFIDNLLILKAIGGKFLNEKNFVGLTFEYAVVAESDQFWSGGLRYHHYYDSQKRNIGLYIPIELQLTSIAAKNSISVDDTLYAEDWSEWPLRLEVPLEFQALTLSLGQGVSFILSNKKTLSCEVAVLTQFKMKEEYLSEVAIIPDGPFRGYGFKGSILFGF